MQNKTTIIISLIAVLAVALWFTKTKAPERVADDGRVANIQQFISYDQLTEEEVKEFQQQEVQQYQNATLQQDQGLAPEGLERYDSTHGFSLWHPGFEVSSVPIPSTGSGQAAGDLTTFDKGPVSFQIFITNLGEESPITPQRIKRDLPNLQMDNIKYANLDGIDTVFFDSNSDELETYEAWIINKGRLYQVMTYRGMEDLLHEVMNTWKWE